MPKLVSALGFFELGRKMKEIENMIDAADSHKSSDSMDEENLREILGGLVDASSAYIGINRTQGMDDDAYETAEAALESAIVKASELLQRI